MNNSIQNQIKPGNLVIAKRSLKACQTTLDFMSLGSDDFDDFFTEEFKKQRNYIPLASICKSDALTFLKTKKHLYYYNGIDAITVYKHYFLNGTKFVYVSLDDKYSQNTFEDIFELVS